MWVVVLDDGQTYSSIDGASLLYVPTSVDDIDGFVKENSEENGIMLSLREKFDTPELGDVFVPRMPYEE